MVIWKYPLRVADQQVIEMPEHATFLDVQIQYGQPCVWALVDPKAPLEFVSIYTFGTGHEIPESRHRYYMGTYQLADGSIVYHVFSAT